MSCFKIKFRFKKLTLSKGQATVEYILLLVVIMAIALGIGGPLGRHLKEFSGAMVGPDGYYACLTKNGILPGKAYTDFAGVDCGRQSSLAIDHIGQIGVNSRSGFGSNFGSSYGSNSGSGSENLDSSGRGEDSGDTGPKSSRHRVKTARSGSSAGKSGSGQGFGEFSNNEMSFSAGSKKKRNKNRKRKKKHRVRGDKLEGDFFNGEKSKRGRIQMQTRQEETYLGDQIYIIEKEEKATVFKVENNDKSVAVSNEEVGKKAGLIADRRPDEDSGLDDKQKAMDFGGFLKYLLIAIMIIAIFVVIFSQVMEYQNRD